MIFFHYLEENIKRIKNVYKSVVVHSIKLLVGKNITNVKLDGVGGTKHAVIDSKFDFGGIFAVSLDKIHSDLDYPKIRLLKTDVDGFDYDGIDSAEQLLTSQHPMIFFECFYNAFYQMVSFKKQ